MKKRASIHADDREFFGRIAAAAFSNPFSEERAQTDWQIAGLADDTPTGERVERILQAVIQRVKKLETSGNADIRLYPAEERAIMEVVFLFEAYHRFFHQLDALIPAQTRLGGAPCPAGFARDALALLLKRGFTKPGALRYFGVFYQLRRAFHFIDLGLVGLSPCMRDFRRRLWNNVFTSDIRCYDRYLLDRMEDFSTLLLGETGTGKGTAAAAIGRSGFIPFDERMEAFAESFTQGFVALNLSQFPESLIESELFGHRKGAFTGAVESHQGILDRCSPHGAIFLDEIGDASVPVQIKLLHVLQDRVFSPVGSHEKLRFRGRVIAATNRPLAELRGLGSFRDDFYYRLCSDQIQVPSLRQRLRESPGELKDLIGHLMVKMTGEGSRELVAMAHETLMRTVGPGYPWPGNVRELEQALRRILLTQTYEGDRPAAAPDLRGRLLEGIEGGTLDADTLLACYCALLYRQSGNYEEVARRASLDRRTVKKYIQQGLALEKFEVRSSKFEV